MELIFSIVILGISAGITLKYIFDIYEQYHISKEIQDLESQIDLTLLQITNRLSNRIKDSVIAYDRDSLNYIYAENSDENYEVLEWVGYDYEGNIGEWNSKINMNIGWSGFIDLNSSDTVKPQIKTPDSNLTAVHEIISSLSNGNCNLTNSCVALMFNNKDSDFNVSKFGWHNSDNKYMKIVNCKDKLNDCKNKDYIDILEFDKPDDINEIYEQYTLSWSAYAIDLNQSTLNLYYNFRPWNNMTYEDGNISILDEQISVFRFRQIGSIIRIKLCKFKEYKDKNITTCKERAIY
ncbi:MAG: hypothetical protein HXX81_02000 [Campylobacterales bacterium]|nr:hypothetical protein [Campylobacterales bacterium]